MFAVSVLCICLGFVNRVDDNASAAELVLGSGVWDKLRFGVCDKSNETDEGFIADAEAESVKFCKRGASNGSHIFRGSLFSTGSEDA
jgi:hypothetical protein